MSGVVRISEAASLALHTVAILAQMDGEKLTTRQIARALNVSEAHLSKVLQRLAKVGIVRSIRGPKGGFTLGKEPGRISMLEVYEAIEGPIQPDECLLGERVCTGVCILGDLVHQINKAVKERLATTKLDHMNSYFSLKPKSD